MQHSIDGAFPATDWSEINRAGDLNPAVRHEAMRVLVLRYLWPMQMHLRLRQRLDADAAEELVQEFLVSKVLGHNLLAQANPDKGHFRMFLLTALDRFASNVARNRRVRRCPSLEEIAEPVDSAGNADREFDADWARQVLAEALRRMRDHCRREGRDNIWAVFDARLLSPALDDAQPVPYLDLVERLRLHSTSEGFNLLATAKRSFARALRCVVGGYEKDPKRIEEEIAALRAALSRRGK